MKTLGDLTMNLYKNEEPLPFFTIRGWIFLIGTGLISGFFGGMVGTYMLLAFLASVGK